MLFNMLVFAFLLFIPIYSIVKNEATRVIIVSGVIHGRYKS